jgi:heme exporter protein A
MLADCREDLAVATERLTKLFGSVPALIEVDLQVPVGSVCAVVGANGAGKTTLLRLLSTGLRPTGGSARILGRDVLSRSDEVRALVDLLPAQAGLYPELTARENLRFALRMRGLPAGAEALDQALAWAGLGAAADAPACALSTGMARRLGLARLRLARAPVLLLDEPYGAVDEEGRSLVDELLAEARGRGATALVASHERGRLGEVADELVELERGCVVWRERGGTGLDDEAAQGLSMPVASGLP